MIMEIIVVGMYSSVSIRFYVMDLRVVIEYNFNLNFGYM